MGQKVNPIGYRLAVNRDWRSRWYASPKELPEFLGSDIKIRNYVKDKLRLAAVSKIVIERAWNSIRVTITIHIGYHYTILTNPVMGIVDFQAFRNI